MAKYRKLVKEDNMQIYIPVPMLISLSGIVLCLIVMLLINIRLVKVNNKIINSDDILIRLQKKQVDNLQHMLQISDEKIALEKEISVIYKDLCQAREAAIDNLMNKRQKQIDMMKKVLKLEETKTE